MALVQLAEVESSERHHAMLESPRVDGGSRYSGSLVGQNPAPGSSGSDSDSGNSIFITQNPVRPQRQRRPGLKSRGRKNGNESDKKRERRVKLPAFTSHLYQEGKPTTLVLNKSQNIHYYNALMGGFFGSVRQLQARETTDLLSSLPTVDQEGDFIAPVSEQEAILEEEDIKVRKKDLVVFSKTKRPQPWYNPPRANRQGGAAERSRKGLGGASRCGSSNGNAPVNRQTGNSPSRIQAEASKTKENRVSQHEEARGKSDSDSDATFCELLEEDAQNYGGASTAGALLQADGREEPEAQGDDFESQKKKSRDLNLTLVRTEQVGESRTCLQTTETSHKGVKKKKKRHQSESEETFIEAQGDGFKSQKRKSKDLNVILDQTEQVGESVTCLETSDKRIKKKKKKRRHRSESEETFMDASFSNEAISLLANQELMVKKKRLDGHSRLVTKKKRHQSESEETCIKAQGDGFKSQKRKSKDLNVTLDQTEQVGESGTCLKMTDKRIKKKKRHQSESEETFMDAISLPANQELMVKKKRLDGHAAGGAEDTQLVRKKRRKRRKKKKMGLPSLNPCMDAVTQSDDSVSVQKTDKRRRTSSFPAADAGTSSSDSAEICKRKKRIRKRKSEPAAGDGKPSGTLQKSRAKIRRKAPSAVTRAGVRGRQDGEDGVVKKKNKATGAVPPAAGRHTQPALVPRSSVPRGETGLTVNGHDASPHTHTIDAPNERRKRKNENPRKLDPNWMDCEMEAAEGGRTEVLLAAGFSEIPAELPKPPHVVGQRKNKRTLHNPSEDSLTGW